MITISTEKQFRDLCDPGFCYICGEPWRPEEIPVTEHVVPECAFLKEDRLRPFYLLAHSDCNQAKSRWDEPIGQVFKILHGTLPEDPRKHRLDHVLFKDADSAFEVGGIGNLDLDRILIGWVKGFHTLLYREYLPHDRHRFAITAPWPSFRGDPNAMEPIHPAHADWVDVLRRSRKANTIDRVIAWNDRLQYQCTWSSAIDGTPICLFGLDIYDWARMADEMPGGRRSCTGVYRPSSGIPMRAARATKLILPEASPSPMDVFQS